MTVELAAANVTLNRDVVAALRLATREAVNASALKITEDARRRVRAVLGPEQRMSRLLTRQRGGKTGRVTAATIEAGGTRINPYYRTADSTTRPVALVGVRGPAQHIEHDRRGGYTVRANRRAVDADTAQQTAELEAELFGRAQGKARNTAARLQRPGALITPNGFYASVKPGPIARPAGGPITAAFRAGTTTIEHAARDALDDSLDRKLRNL